jgi:hypothetical protein
MMAFFAKGIAEGKKYAPDTMASVRVWQQEQQVKKKGPVSDHGDALTEDRYGTVSL